MAFEMVLGQWGWRRRKKEALSTDDLFRNFTGERSGDKAKKERAGRNLLELPT